MNRLLLLTVVPALAACSYRGGPSQPPPPGINKVVVSPASPTVAVGKTVQLTATAYDRDGRPVAGAAITWKSEATAVATVDQHGVVTGVAPGSTQISATATASSAATVTVVGP